MNEIERRFAAIDPCLGRVFERGHASATPTSLTISPAIAWEDYVRLARAVARVHALTSPRRPRRRRT